MNSANRYRYHCVPVILGSRTGEKAREKFAVLELDLIAVKRKTEPETIYLLLGHQDIAGDDRTQALFNDALLLPQPRLGRRPRASTYVDQASIGMEHFLGSSAMGQHW